jgi:hypothetical protein
MLLHKQKYHGAYTFQTIGGSFEESINEYSSFKKRDKLKSNYKYVE